MTCYHCDEDEAHCEICGEHFPHETEYGMMYFNCEVGEFVGPDDRTLIAHAQCGLSRGYPLA